MTDVIKILFEAYPKAVQVQDKDGKLPLHISLRKKTSLDVIKILFDAYPEAAQVPDKDGRLLLHIVEGCKQFHSVPF